MGEAIAVLNAGSSSLKFSLFARSDAALELTVRGQAEGLYTAPRFVAKDRDGKTLGEKTWGSAKLGHDGALDYLIALQQYARHVAEQPAAWMPWNYRDTMARTVAV